MTAWPQCLTAPSAPPRPIHLKPVAARVTNPSPLHDILEQQQLSAVLQPIIDMASGAIMGYEGLVRGPIDSPLHAPVHLFHAARQAGLTVETEFLCRRVVLETFARLQLPGKLFLNVSPECLLPHSPYHGETIAYMQELGLSPDRVVIELTENQPIADYADMRDAVLHYRKMGFQIAIDDLGEGFASLRMWSELQPDFVKIDMHFIQGINTDPVKLQFVRSIQEIADKTSSRVIAEGIESQAELLVLRDLGIACGQGYHLGRPLPRPATVLGETVLSALGRGGVAVYPQAGGEKQAATIVKLLQATQAISPSLNNNEVYDIFMQDASLLILPIVDAGLPLGLISRYNMIDHFARPYQRELYGKKSCTVFMDANCIMADKSTTLQALSVSMVQADAHQLSNGFIITDEGRYLGMGRGHDLMREITQMQIHAARYANPLTQLPGNVPINEHIERLLSSKTQFWAVYADLDHFKPFNDAYGYRKGDDVIALTGALLSSHVDPDRDFVGHIGGDDFMVLFQSEDWEQRCSAILTQFERAIGEFFGKEERQQGGYQAEDRQGRKMFTPLVSLSLGAVRVEPEQCYSHHQIAASAAAAKKQAKKTPGNSLFMDRRSA
jgi:diguanylate cyclase (GGDEF)-like protein